MLILKSVWKGAHLRITKTILTQKSKMEIITTPDIKVYSVGTVVKIVRCAGEERDIYHKQKIQKQSPPPQTCPTDF